MSETYVTFNGANASVDEDPGIKLGDRVEFSGWGECIRVAEEKRGDGEHRPVITIKVAEVDLGDITEAPDDPQLTLDDEDAALGAGDDSDGGE